jgi:putative tryptophan/tyrosine transport system substrate-binding protein
MNRREAIIALVALGAVPRTAGAQQSAKVHRIGLLAGTLVVGTRTVEAFRQGLRDLGYVEGRNLVIEYRDAEGKLEFANVGGNYGMGSLLC